MAGNDWWYYGDKCQHRGSEKDRVNLALLCSLPVFAGMLIILVITVICVKKKYQKRESSSAIKLGSVKATQKL